VWPARPHCGMVYIMDLSGKEREKNKKRKIPQKKKKINK
jgi:hypothetical protein